MKQELEDHAVNKELRLEINYATYLLEKHGKQFEERCLMTIREKH